MKTPFVICISNEGAPDLDPRKVYRVVPDPEAAADGLLRVVDETGEDYLYPEAFFAEIELSDAAADALRVP